VSQLQQLQQRRWFAQFMNQYNTPRDRFCSLVVGVPGYITEMYCASCEVRTELIYVMLKKVDRLCGLVVRVPGYITEMYCDYCEVRTVYICYVEESRPPLWSSGRSSWLQIHRSGFDSRSYQISEKYWVWNGVHPAS
jgi:hypothetical protein